MIGRQILHASALALSLGASLCACSTSAVPMSQTTPVPADCTFYCGKPSPYAMFIVIRDSSGSLGNPPREILLVGEVVALILKNERLTLFVSPGEHLVSGRLPRGLNTSVKSVAATAEPGKVHIFRAGIDHGGDHTTTRGVDDF